MGGIKIQLSQIELVVIRDALIEYNQNVSKFVLNQTDVSPKAREYHETVQSLKVDIDSLIK